MSRILFASILILTIVSTSAAAGTVSHRSPAVQEELVRDFERLFYELYGQTGPAPEVYDHGGGLKSLDLKLDAATRDRLAPGLKAKSLLILAVGHQISTPGSATTLISTVLSSLRLEYNYWFVVLNVTDTDETVKTTRKLKGPGLKFNRTADLVFPANTIKVFWDETDEGLGKTGIYQHQVKGAGGAGNAKMRFLAQ